MEESMRDSDKDPGDGDTTVQQLCMYEDSGDIYVYKLYAH